MTIPSLRLWTLTNIRSSVNSAPIEAPITIPRMIVFPMRSLLRVLLRHGCGRLLVMALNRQVDGQLDGAAHGSGVGAISSDDIERGPVIRAGANDGQADRQIHRAIERQQLDGN